ncbi:Asp-tRNA(Asn)/Glu-tRNA(Gln) amidotransferase subunit GatC [Barrientosiimonas marina]|uniref:Aspartyl/glutamyl-tRNA(Asn/Gln) amidotransferase subunit C n=1 Tax=Lentibacillus kimchii TaxID=1542911 RepID=A0ABW2UV76_9BACI
MADITKEQIKHIAETAKIAITDEEADRFTDDLSSVIHYADKLQDVDTEGVEPTIFMTDLQNVMRDDEPTNWTSREDLLKNAPDRQDGYFRVPSILD